MTKRTLITSHTSSQRDSWWWLEQDADGSLHVRHENDDDMSTNWRKPLHEAVASNAGSIREELQAVIDRMFREDDA